MVFFTFSFLANLSQFWYEFEVVGAPPSSSSPSSELAVADIVTAESFFSDFNCRSYFDCRIRHDTTPFFNDFE